MWTTLPAPSPAVTQCIVSLGRRLPSLGHRETSCLSFSHTAAGLTLGQISHDPMREIVAHTFNRSLFRLPKERMIYTICSSLLRLIRCLLTSKWIETSGGELNL